MQYQFPVITDIEQVREAIKGRTEFFEADREHFIVFNYLVNTPDTFPPVSNEQEALLRECRGIIFSKDGKVLSRRFHKFFNANERDETRNLDLSKPHVILEKLDGSMITPIKVGDGFRWGTKMGITEVAMNAEAFIAANPEMKYNLFAQHAFENEFTPIFEWCSRKNQIVIDYSEDKLVLIAIRHNETGIYLPYEMLVEAAVNLYNVPVINRLIFGGSDYNMNRLVEHTRDLKGAEGFVVRFDDGHMVKIKADEYVMMHRAKDMIRFEKNVLLVMMEDKVDDLIPILNENDRERLIKYSSKVMLTLESFEYMIPAILKNNIDLSRKEFALEIVPQFQQSIHSILFGLFDRRHEPLEELRVATHQMLVDKVKRACGTIAGVEKVRYLIGATWSEEASE